jgi:hypothetical protein
LRSVYLTSNCSSKIPKEFNKLEPVLCDADTSESVIKIMDYEIYRETIEYRKTRLVAVFAV